MVKKWIAASLSLLMAAGCLAGCGGQDNEEQTATQAGSPVTINGDKIYPVQCDDTLTYWSWLSSTVSSKHENFGDTPLAKETAKRTGIKVEYVHPDGGGNEQLQLLIASDALPDIVVDDWNNYGGGPQTAIDDGYIFKLNDLIEKYSPALKKTLTENPDYDRLVKNDNGNYYAYPFLLQEGILQVFYGPIVREDWLKKLNMEAPETIDEWETMLLAFKNEFGAEIPYCASATELMTVFAGAFGVYLDWYIDDGKPVYGPAEPGYKELLIKLNDWFNKGLIDQDMAVAATQQVRANMLGGQSGAMTGYAGGDIGDLLQSAKANEETEEGYNLIGVKYPTKEKGQTPEYTSLAGTVNMGCSAAISKNCVNPELAARFLDYGFTEEGHILYNFGIEGESFEWINDYPTYTQFITDNQEDWTMTEAMGAYMQSAYNGIMVQDQRYIEQYYKLPQQKDAQKNWGVTNMNNHLMPQLYLDNAERDKDDVSKTNIKTYVDEMTLKFITGAEPFENYDKYLAQIETFGLSDAKQFRQNAYERFLNR